MAFSLIKDIDNFFTKFFAKTTSAQKVLATVGALTPLIEAGLTVEDPASAPVVTAAFTEVQTDLGTFQSIVKQSDLVSPSCGNQNPARAGAEDRPWGGRLPPRVRQGRG